MMNIRGPKALLLISVLSLLVALSLLSYSQTWNHIGDLRRMSSIQITDIRNSDMNKDPQHQAEDPTPPALRFQPLVEDEPVMLHILAYQRTASTVIGNLLGDLDGHFFIYEPLDLTFSAMYGTDTGWNVPSDIFNDAGTGDIRPADKDEVAAIRWTMESIYQCKMADNWPIAFLIHPFWLTYKTRAMRMYKACITENMKNSKVVISSSTLPVCLGKLGTLCGGHFNGSSTKLQKCKNVLYRDGYYTTDVDETSINGSGFTYTTHEIEKFKNYFTCLKNYEEKVRGCARQHLDEQCEKSHIRVIKTVRASMHIPVPYFKTFSNFRLVHLFRDPRGTAKSRLDAQWSHGIYEFKNLTRIAAAYCKNVHSDYVLRQDLEQKFPGQIMQIISDDFMIFSMDYIEDMAQFIGKNITLMKHRMKERLKKEGIDAKESIEHNQNYLEDKNNTTVINSTQKAASRNILQAEDDPGSFEELGKYLEKYTQDSYTSYLRHILGFVKKPAVTGQTRLQTWQKSFLWHEVKDIELVCKTFLSYIPYDWS